MFSDGEALAQANALARRSKGSSVVNEDSRQSVNYSQASEYGVSSIAQPQITSYSHPMYSQPIYTQPVYSQPAQQQVVYSQPEVQYVQLPQRVMMQREVPKCAYDVRTVMVPKSVTEDYTVMETRMVAIQIPVAMQRQRWISVPREISIPRPMIEKRIIKKMVPKTIEVEESYEVESAVTEIEIYEQPSVQGYTGMPVQQQEEIVYDTAPGQYETVQYAPQQQYVQQAATHVQYMQQPYSTQMQPSAYTSVSTPSYVSGESTGMASYSVGGSMSYVQQR